MWLIPPMSSLSWGRSDSVSGMPSMVLCSSAVAVHPVLADVERGKQGAALVQDVGGQHGGSFEGQHGGKVCGQSGWASSEKTEVLQQLSTRKNK